MKYFLTYLLLFTSICFSKIYTQNLYPLDTITNIELSFAEQDWEYPLHYYKSLKKGDRHIGHAIVNGHRFDSVGVRFKGFSSYRKKFKKNPLNIKLDYIHKKANYQKYGTLKLSNGNLDPSWLREVLGYQIARKYMIAPNSNYAEIFVNGRYYGLFGNTEDVGKKFGKRHFYINKGNVIIKGNAPEGPFSGYQSSLEYLGEDTTLYMQAYELKSNYGWQKLKELTWTLKHKSEKIEDILNMDAAIWMLAFNNVIINLDSYSDFQQNYYLIEDNYGRFNFILWDLNLAFDGLGKPSGVNMQYNYDPLSKINNEKYPLINLVLNNPKYRKIYFAHCRTILNENFSNGWYQKEITKHRKLISSKVKSDTNWAFPFQAFQQNYLSIYSPDDTGHFPYPGIIELMESRTNFLNNHPEYIKPAPQISDIKIDSSGINSNEIIISVYIENATAAFLFFRQKSNSTFREVSLTKKDGNIFSTDIHVDNKKMEYYILAENKEAVIFSPERAEHEFYVFQLNE